MIGQRLAFSAVGRDPLRLDPAALRAVFCYGAVGVTDEAMKILFRHEVEVAWMTRGGARCLGRLVGRHEQAANSRIIQHRVLASAAAKLTIARGVVESKIASQIEARAALPAAGLRECRRGPAALNQAAAVPPGAVAGQLAGHQGQCQLRWVRIARPTAQPALAISPPRGRPPTDPVNALLSLAYTWLTNRATARIQAHGLEVALGALTTITRAAPRWRAT